MDLKIRNLKLIKQCHSLTKLHKALRGCRSERYYGFLILALTEIVRRATLEPSRGQISYFSVCANWRRFQFLRLPDWSSPGAICSWLKTWVAGSGSFNLYLLVFVARNDDTTLIEPLIYIFILTWTRHLLYLMLKFCKSLKSSFFGFTECLLVGLPSFYFKIGV